MGAETQAPELDDLVVAILGASGQGAALARRAVVLIDGRSGAGKTALAEWLAPRLDAQLISLDELYPGWEGLEAGSDAVHETVLREQAPGWTRWDWTRARPGEWHPLDPDRAIVVEGCGALSRANRALATFGIWLELDADERHRRASERDRGRFDRYWVPWAAQEDAFIAREHPPELADWVVDGVVDGGLDQP
ncbi:MAG TPA: ATP-binding protein [Pseudolysinimonas sp.]